MKYANLLVFLIFCCLSNAEEAIIFEQQDFAGKSIKIPEGNTLDVYEIAQLGKNIVRSLKIPDGLALEICVNMAPEKAPCNIYLKDVPKLPLMFQDTVSRVRVFKLNSEHFSLLFASDTQFFWEFEAPSDYRRSGDWTKDGNLGNSEFVKAANTLAEQDRNSILGLIINGDLTSYGHERELLSFLKYYGFNIKDNKPSINLPVFPGLGNHDYSNNVKRDLTDIYGEGCFNNGCVLRMIDFIKHFATNNPHIESFDPNSLSYSWSVNDYVFVQLHNYPTYKVEFGYFSGIYRRDVKITSSLPWLKNILESAKQAGKKVILNFHDYYSQANVNNSEFNNIIANSSVEGIFVGHLHSVFGKTESFFPTADHEIPVFHLGSVMSNSLTMVEFYKQSYIVKLYSTLDGIPTLKNNFIVDIKWSK